MKKVLCFSSVAAMCMCLMCLVTLFVLPRFGVFDGDSIAFKPYGPSYYPNAGFDIETDSNPEISKLEENVKHYFSDLISDNDVSANDSDKVDILAGTYLREGVVNVIFYHITRDEFDSFYDNCVAGNEESFSFFSADYPGSEIAIVREELSDMDAPPNAPHDDSLTDEGEHVLFEMPDWSVSDVKKLNTAGLPMGISALRRDSLDLTGGVRIFINRLGKSFKAEQDRE